MNTKSKTKANKELALVDIGPNLAADTDANTDANTDAGADDADVDVDLEAFLIQ